MTKRTQALKVLGEFFEKEGRIYTAHEYQHLHNQPIRMVMVKRIFGSWGRMENILRKPDSRNFRDENYVPDTNVDEVIAQRNAALEATRALVEDVEEVARPNPLPTTPAPAAPAKPVVPAKTVTPAKKS